MTRRLTAPNVEISKNFSDHDDDPADNEVLVSIRSWGNAAFVFPDLAERADWRKPENTLWQARIFHTGRRSLGYMLLDAARAALRVHPDASMKTLEQLQQNHHVKLLSGGPPSSGDPDPDGMEFTPWQPVIYAAGESPMPILELLQYLVKHHCTCGHWRHTPPLAIRIQEWTWAAKPATAMDAPLPPKHERHRLFPCSPTNHKTTYTMPTQPRCKPSRSLHPHPLRQPLPVQTTAQQRKHSGRTSSSIRQRKESHVRQTKCTSTTSTPVQKKEYKASSSTPCATCPSILSTPQSKTPTSSFSG